MDVSNTKRKVKKGTVVSNKMNKTVIVRCEITKRHPQYGKVITRFNKHYAHTESEKPLNVGDTVTIVETRPISKLKRWLVVEGAA